MKYGRKILWCAGALLPAAVFFADMMCGSSGISPAEVLKALAGRPTDGQTMSIVMDIRLPKALTALLAGIAVSVSGLLMQTLFQNPLAGPYVLGISSGASLGAAMCVLGASSPLIGPDSFAGSVGIAGAAWLGAAAVLLCVAYASRRIGNAAIILILGMMLGSGIDAFVQILQFLSDEQSLKSYVLWTMGSLGNVSWLRMGLLIPSVILGTGMAMACSKPLNLLLCGETYAATTGTDIRRTRALVYLSTILLSGTVTAFCGPLGFIGLAVPHLTRFITRSADHSVLIPGTAICGGSLMLVCDMISKTAAIPVNAVTALTGIPIIIIVLLSHGKLSRYA